MTFVTGFWPPEALGRSWRSTDVYMRLFEELDATLTGPLVIFIEPQLADRVRTVVEKTQSNHARYVIARSYADLPRVAEKAAYEKLAPIQNGSSAKDTAGAALMTWAKPSLVVEVAEENRFDTSHFAWIDFGIAYVADLTGVDFGAIADHAPEEVRVCEMRATSPREAADAPNFYRANWGKIAAGFFTGTKASLRAFDRELGIEIERMRSVSRIVLEEQLMAAVAAHDPTRYARWYGDYSGILRNYVRIRRDADTILDNLAYCREQNLHEQGVAIVTTLLASMNERCIRLEPPQAARLLDEGYTCAFYTDRDLADRLAHIASALYHYGTGLRDRLDGLGERFRQNLSYRNVSLETPAWSWDEFARQPDLTAWCSCL